MTDNRWYYETAEATLTGDRPVNEDRLAIARKDDALLLVVADGLGGHPRGDLAAAASVEAIVSGFLAAAAPADPQHFLAKLLHQAHRAVVAHGAGLPPTSCPLTTCVACLVIGGRAWSMNVGDSRFYLFREGATAHRSRDHTLAAELHEQGLISAEDVAVHPGRNRLSRCLGGRWGAPEAAFDGPFELAAADMILLCSDGLWGPLKEASIVSGLAQAPLQAAVEALANQARAAGRPYSDNVSLTALRVLPV